MREIDKDTSYSERAPAQVPHGVELTRLPWQNGMLTTIYNLNGGLVKHISTGKIPRLQTKQAQLYQLIQHAMVLVRDGGNSA